MQNRIRGILSITGILWSAIMFAQETSVVQTFKDTRVINMHSVETVPQRHLDFRITHRFGDLAGSRGGWGSFYGLETAQDISIGFEYGLTNQVTAGFYRSKGAGRLKQLLNGYLKSRVLQQKSDGSPLSVTILGLATISTMQKSENKELINFFQSPSQRMAYHAQVLVSRKFTEGFSLQLSGSLTHRNLVLYNDVNDIYSVGLATRIRLNDVFGFIFESTYPISEIKDWDLGYYFPLGVGLEIETGSHVFQVTVTNASGIAETDYISYSESNWEHGQFRLGFTISRKFKLF